MSLYVLDVILAVIELESLEIRFNYGGYLSLLQEHIHILYVHLKHTYPPTNWTPISHNINIDYLLYRVTAGLYRGSTNNVVLTSAVR